MRVSLFLSAAMSGAGSVLALHTVHPHNRDATQPVEYPVYILSLTSQNRTIPPVTSNIVSLVMQQSREQIVHALYEAAELEHNLMCTYLYAAFSLRTGESEGLSSAETAAVARWRRAIMDVAIDEMGHLAAIWNITSALGVPPRFGRGNFPLDPGYLPAGVVVKLAPFNEAVLQHFIHLERPVVSNEPDGEGFAPEFAYRRRQQTPRLTPMGLDYETVGEFYATLGQSLRSLVDRVGESNAFCGDPALQLSPTEVDLSGAKPVICLKTAIAAFQAIVEQGEGAPEHSADSHFQKFAAIRKEFAPLKAANPNFKPAFPAAHNPVLRTPVKTAGRVWIENETAAATVDLANASYALMLRLLAYSYSVPRPSPEKAAIIDLSIGLMRTVNALGERAARLPAGPSNPDCNAGMSFTALRDAASLPLGISATRFFTERFAELTESAHALNSDGDTRTADAVRFLGDLSQRAARELNATATPPRPTTPSPAPVTSSAAPASKIEDGVEKVQGAKLELHFEAKKCIHARFCVTGAPKVFLANVKGPWIYPDAMDVENLAAIAHACPSGAIRYQRKDGRPDEFPPPVNLISVREAGPYAVRADIRINGQPAHFRATLCRCGASKNKPFCDGSHHEVGFSASGEPATGQADMLPVRDGELAINPQTDGPLQIRGNVEIVSGTGRVVARLTQAKLCRCGASNNKPFCDGSHSRVGFKST